MSSVGTQITAKEYKITAKDEFMTKTSSNHNPKMETQKPLTEFTDEELLQEEKKRKEFVKYNSFFIGLLAGIAIWSIVKSGLGFLPFILFGAILYLINADKKYKAVKAEIEARNLNT